MSLWPSSFWLALGPVSILSWMREREDQARSWIELRFESNPRKAFNGWWEEGTASIKGKLKDPRWCGRTILVELEELGS